MMQGDRHGRVGHGRSLVLAGVVLWAAGQAHAMSTVCGTIITNVAVAAMSSGFPEFVQYEVSYNATATITVLCSPVVALRKFANGEYVTAGSAGSAVTFSICVENQTADTVWGVSVTDRLPDNMVFVDLTGNAYDLTTPSLGVPALVNAATVAGLTAGVVGPPPAGQGVNWYLRWSYVGIGPGKSACTVYRARIL